MAASIVYTCDRCGQIITKDPKIGQLRMQNISVHEYCYDNRHKCYDLCLSCSDKLASWLTGNLFEENVKENQE